MIGRKLEDIWVDEALEYDLPEAIMAMERELLKRRVCEEQGLTTGPSPKWMYQTYEEVLTTPWATRWHKVQTRRPLMVHGRPGTLAWRIRSEGHSAS
jgi:hypothetical protein